MLVPEEEIRSIDPSGSNKNDDKFISLDPQLQKMSHKSISRRHFDIEGVAFIVAP